MKKYNMIAKAGMGMKNPLQQSIVVQGEWINLKEEAKGKEFIQKNQAKLGMTQEEWNWWVYHKDEEIGEFKQAYDGDMAAYKDFCEGLKK